MATAALTKTFGSASSASDRYKFTFSTWFKRGTAGDNDYLFGHQSSSGANDFAIRLDKDSGNSLLRVYDYQSNSYNLHKQTTRFFRDHSAWYHLVVKIDTTQSSASDRVKIYINGVEETSFSTSVDPNQNQSVYAFSNTGRPTVIGGRYTSSLAAGYYFDGSLAHTHCCIGYAYDASSFGETDSTSGIWKPKTNPSVTYGSNGFFLKFENSGAMGTDSSGNSNTFTVNGTLTQNVDTPSNNFATMNPIDKSGNPNPPTFANGNLSVDSVATNQNATARSTLAVSTGKWYVEAKQVGTASPEYMRIGILGADSATYVTNNESVGGHATGYAYKSTGVKANNNSESSYGNSYTNGDIIGIAFDATNGTIWFSKNGTWQNSATITEIQNGTTSNSAFSSISMTRDFMFASSMAGASSGLKYEWNFGSGFFGTTAVASANADANGFGAFEYSVPSGYYALCTKNIKEFG
jgi:hypothetical protein